MASADDKWTKGWKDYGTFGPLLPLPDKFWRHGPERPAIQPRDTVTPLIFEFRFGGSPEEYPEISDSP